MARKKTAKKRKQPAGEALSAEQLEAVSGGTSESVTIAFARFKPDYKPAREEATKEIGDPGLSLNFKK